MNALPRLLTALIFGSTLCVYLAWLTKLYYWDGVFFALTIETAPTWKSLLHPNHLLYESLGALFFKICAAAVPGVRALVALQILSAVSGAAAAAMMFTLLRRVSSSNYIPACLTMVFAFSATWWRFATDANAYAPAIACLLLSVQLLTTRRPRIIAAAVAFAASLCLHELAVIALPALLMVVWFRAATEERVRATASFAMLSGCMTLYVYAICSFLAGNPNEPHAFAAWITSFSPDADTAFDAARSLTMSLRGNVRLFFGGRVSWLKSVLDPLTITVIVAGTVALIALVVRSVRARIARTKVRSEDKSNLSLLPAFVVWIACYSIFLFFWLPQNTFYRLFYLPAMVLVIGAVISKYADTRRYYRLALATCVFAAANFLFLIYPLTKVERNPPLKLALDLHDDIAPGATVLVGRDNADATLVRYVNQQAEWRTAGQNNASAIIGELAALGRDVWLETTAVDTLSSDPHGTAWLNEHTVPGTLQEIENGEFRVRFLMVRP